MSGARMKSNNKKETINLYAIQIANMLVPFAVFPYLTKTLGVASFGKISYIQSIVLLMMFVVNYGYDYFGAKLISIESENIKKRTAIYFDIQMAKSIISLLVILVGYCICLSGVLEGDETVALSICLPCVLGSVLTPTWLFQGMQQLSRLAVCTVISRLICLILTIIFVKSQDDIAIAAFLQLFPYMLVGVAASFISVRSGMIDIMCIEPSAKKSFQYFIESSHVFLGSAMTLGFTYGNPILIKILLGDQAVGQYAAAEKITTVLRQLFLPLIQGSYSKVCRLYQGDSSKEINVIIKNVFVVMIFLIIFALAGTIFLSDMIFPVILGEEYHIKWMLVFLIISQLFAAISLVEITFVIIPSGIQSVLKKVYFIALLMHALYVIPLTLKWGGNGMAVSMIITEGVVAVIAFSYIKKHRSKCL